MMSEIYICVKVEGTACCLIGGYCVASPAFEICKGFAFCKYTYFSKPEAQLTRHCPSAAVCISRRDEAVLSMAN